MRKTRITRLALWLILAILLGGVIGSVTRSQQNDWAENTISRLTLRDKIAQLVHIRTSGKFINRQSKEFKKIADQITENHVGGLVLFSGNVYESAMLLNDFQELSQLPLLVSADFERGAAFRITDTTSFPWTMSLGAADSEELAYREGMATARESRAMGVHWIFAPVVDVNNNPDNPVINIRAFGEVPEQVARLGGAFIRGARAGGVLTTAKHFPGHGDTTTDSHVNMPVVQSDMARLQAVEFVPFRRAIDVGVDTIMTAHVAVPQITGDTETPATLSPAILTDVLKNTLGFQGIVVTDALEMAGIAKRYGSGKAAVLALKAGADVLLLPADVDAAINEVEQAVQNGEISEERINYSVGKILAAKSMLRLDKKRLTDIEKIGDIVSSPEHLALAQEIADSAVTVVRDKHLLLPVNPSIGRRVYGLVLTPGMDQSSGAPFLEAFKARFPKANTGWSGANISKKQLAVINKSIADADIVVIATLTRLATGQNIGVPESHSALIKKLAASRKPVVWICLGSPYLLRLAPEIGTWLCTFSYSETSQVAAVKALTGEIRVSGKMPVSIPGIVAIGDGMNIPARVVPKIATDGKSSD